jgi:hypothetical protein
MSLPITALEPDYSRRRKNRRYSVQPTGNYVANGDVLDFSTILNPNFFGDVNLSNVPAFGEVSFEVPDGYKVQMVPAGGTTLATSWLLEFFTTAGVQLAAGAYPAALLATPIIMVVSQRAWAN